MNRFIASIITIGILHLPAGTQASPLTLKQCVEDGIRSNPALSVVRHDREIAATTVRLTESSSYPRIDLQGGYTMQQEPQAVVISGRKAETQQAAFGFLNSSLSYTIYDFGRRDYRQSAARSSEDAVRSTVSAREQEVTLQIITTYFAILESQKLISAAEEEVVQVGEHGKIAETLYQQGVVTRNDVLQAEVRLASARQKLLASQNRRENLWLQLNYLLGAEPSRRAELDDGTDIALPADFSPDPRQAAETRPELRAFRKNLESASFELKEAGSSFYPELFTRLAFDYVENERVSEQAIMSATIGLRLNIFDGFATSAGRQRTSQAETKARDNLRQAETQIRLELDTAFNDSRVARERIAVTRTAIRQSEENLRINSDRYQARVGTATDVLDAQTLLTQTKTEHYQALYDFQVASARVRRALGEL